jgi:endonuclease/exonuclease/phosphatase family metal-dependent hydrolase
MANVVLLNWNLEWAAPDSPRGKTIRDTITDSAADIVCLTETQEIFPSGEGHAAFSQTDYGYPIKDDRWKVALWSRHPWDDIDCIGHSDLPPGRFVSGRTETSIGVILVIGVCIPWAQAHVATGRRNRRPWEDHISYVTALGKILASTHQPAILMGDFNQSLPRRRAPADAERALRQALSPSFSVATWGLCDADGHACIDHICHTRSLKIDALSVIPSISRQGQRLSDHFGVQATLGRAHT